MKIKILAMTVLWSTAVACMGLTPYLDNAGFEMEFGSREDLNVWGDFGESFGESYPVYATGENTPAAAHEGKRVLLINVPQNSWNGLWQQTPWRENAPLEWSAWVMILGDLPNQTTTFMKIEFYDALDHLLAEETGERLSTDTGNQWKAVTMRAVAPPGTVSARLVLIAGSNPTGPALVNRIFWDDASLQQQD